MATIKQRLTTCLWFDGQGEEAANFYVSIFPDSKLGTVTRYTKAGFEIHGQPEGKAMTVSFTLNGQEFTALNGGPQFKFSEAISFVIPCEDQQEVDHYWNKLTQGGKEVQCGWLTDKFGLSWQVVPVALTKMMSSGDTEKVQRVTNAFMQMKKLDIAALEKAFNG